MRTYARQPNSTVDNGASNALEMRLDKGRFLRKEPGVVSRADTHLRLFRYPCVHIAQRAARS